jgi:uncharacterized membrane protein YbhN (UPF0104 family)
VIAAFLDHASVLAQQFESLDGRFLLGALVLQVSNLALRGFAWRNVLAAAYPEQRVSYLSVAGSYVAGVALNTFTPGRAGELAKVLLVRTRIAGSAVPTIAAALSVVLVFDAIVGGALVAALWAGGGAPRLPGPGAPVLLAVGAIGAVVTLALAFAARRSSQARQLLTRAWVGVGIVRSPGRYLRSVALVQLGAWMCRIGVVMLVLAAFGIPPTPSSAVLVLVAGGISTAVPIPGGGGAQQLLVAYALHSTVSVSQAISFSVGMQSGVALVNTLVGITALMLMFRTLRPAAAVRSARAVARGRGRPS